MDWTMMSLEAEVGLVVGCHSPRNFVATTALVTKTSIYRYPQLNPGVLVLYPRWFTLCMNCKCNN